MDSLTPNDWILIYGCFAIHLAAFVTILWRWKTSKQRIDLAEVLLVMHAYLIVLFINYGIGVALLDVNRTSRIVVERGILTRQEAAAIVRVSEEEAAHRGAWSSDRHASYPTTDIDISTVHRSIRIGRDEEDFYAWTLRMVNSRIVPKLSAAYKVPLSDFVIKELFVVKYDATAQRSLSEHQDAAMITFNVALSDAHVDYTGGGTEFVISGDVVNIDKGDMLCHESGVSHCGHPITSGTRYILIGLLNVASSSKSSSSSGGSGGPAVQQGRRLWWRGYGSTASCLILPRDAIVNNTKETSLGASTAISTAPAFTTSHGAEKKACINVLWPYWRKLKIPLGELMDAFRSGSIRMNKRVEDGSINDTGTNKAYVRFLVVLLGLIGLAIVAFTIYMLYVIWDEHIRGPSSDEGVGVDDQYVNTKSLKYD
jgi:hypothetical protein